MPSEREGEAAARPAGRSPWAAVLAVAGLFAALAAAWFGWYFWTRIERNETEAIEALRNYASAQALYRRNDWNGDRVLEYASRFEVLATQADAGGQPLRLIGDGMAAARWPDGRPFRGYLFGELKTIGGVEVDWLNDYALCATPAVYGVTGRRTYVITGGGVVTRLDLGKSVIVADAPAPDPQRSWGPVAE